MYEDITYETILQRMLDRVPSGMDKREGSIIYDALAPAAVELQLMYIELDTILKQTFADTATRTYLLRRVAERGITPEAASYAVLKGEFTPTTLTIPTGSRFSCGTLNYVSGEKISDGCYQMTCETIGEEGNSNFGQMIPINYIAGLQTAKLTELLIPGEDEEDTESVRERYFDSFDSKAYGGNVADYIQKTNAISGVGGTKVEPIWNGGGTVKLVIIDSEYNKASDTLIDTVQQTIDPTKDGYGLGVAPIGHVVTVVSADEVTVNVNTSITFKDGYTWSSMKATIEEVIENYLLEIRKEWADSSKSVIRQGTADTSKSVVRISQIESRIMDITGVLDIADTKINDVASNLTLEGDEIPILGGVTNA